MNAKQILVECIKSEINPSYLNNMTINVEDTEAIALYEIAKAHDMAHIIGKAIQEKRLVVCKEMVEKFNRQMIVAIYRYEQKKSVAHKIDYILEKNEIPHMFLKGAILEELYPEPWLRTSCDIDILVPDEYIEKTSKLLCERLLCRREDKGSHDIQFYTPENVHIELHFKLIETMQKSDEVLSQVWEMARIKENSKATYLMTDKMFYFYHIAHMAKHFVEGGIGVRAFGDLWLLNHYQGANVLGRKELLEHAGLTDFEKYIRKLSEIWFDKEEHDDLTCIMQQYVWTGGVYGNLANRVLVQRTKYKSKINFVIKRIFMPYKEMQIEYPKLKNRRFLLPIYWMIRFARCIKRGRLKHAREEFQLNRTIRTDKQTDIKELMLTLNLD